MYIAIAGTWTTEGDCKETGKMVIGLSNMTYPPASITAELTISPKTNSHHGRVLN